MSIWLYKKVEFKQCVADKPTAAFVAVESIFPLSRKRHPHMEQYKNSKNRYI
jgi:hypothetical protein